jgi:hypothetical protein
MSRVWRWAAVALLGLTLAGCGDGADPPAATEGSDGSVEFLPVTHPDGTEYRCLYTYRGAGYGGGPAMWCERQREDES